MYTYELTMSSGKVHAYELPVNMDKLLDIVEVLTFITITNTLKCKCSLIESIEQFITSEYQPTSTKLDL